MFVHHQLNTSHLHSHKRVPRVDVWHAKWLNANVCGVNLSRTNQTNLANENNWTPIWNHLTLLLLMLPINRLNDVVCYYVWIETNTFFSLCLFSLTGLNSICDNTLAFHTLCSQQIFSVELKDFSLILLAI